jgi:hypothetical protein
MNRLACFAVLLASTAAGAEPRQFGIGLELGEPSGLNGKYYLHPDRAIDFGVGEIYDYFNRYGLHVYVDYLWHPVRLGRSPSVQIPFYIGLGARVWDFEDRGRSPTDHAYAYGLRIPIGIAFELATTPLDFFVQVVPTLDFYSNYALHDFYIDVDVSAGLRLWF